MIQTGARGRSFPGYDAVKENIVPDIDDTYNLGSLSKRWAAIYVVLALLTSITIGGIINLSVSGGQLIINDTTNIQGNLTVDNNLLVKENITAIGNITSENVFIPQYIFSHTNETIGLNTVNVWQNITFDQEVASVKFGISHTFNDNTNQTFTINENGIYNLGYDYDVVDTSLSASDIDAAGRIIYKNGTEIDGSAFESDITKQQIETEISHSTLARLLIGDEIIFQFTADDADVQISTHGTFGDHPDSATIIINKIANI